MSEYLLMLFVGLAVSASLVTWFLLARPLGQTHVRVDFDHYKDREGR